MDEHTGRRRPKPTTPIVVQVKHTIDLHVHDARPESSAILQAILTGVATLQKQGKVTMAKIDDMRAALTAANETTNEIAADVAELVQKAQDGTLTDADIAGAQALVARLQGVAAAYTADGEPPVEG
jgi:dihydroxyacetone kinase-like predicted kinase